MENPLESPLIAGKRLGSENIYRKYISHNWESSEKLRLFGMRIVGVTLIIITICIVSLLQPSQISGSECMIDKIFIATSSLNTFLAKNPNVKDLIIILSSLFLDIGFLIFVANYVVWSKTWREIIALLMFYSLRGILQTIDVLGFPEGFIWGFPGMYSFVITYVKSSDFFYSGHVGFMLLCAISSYGKDLKLLMWYCLFCSFFEGCVMLLVRCHYGIDVVGGLVFAHYLWMISEAPTRFFDKYIGYQPWIFTKD